MFRSTLGMGVVAIVLAGNVWALPVPTASYLFEDNLQDSSGNGNHGTAVGNLGYGNNSVNGTRALSLTNYSDATMDYVSCPNSLGASSVLTLSFLMNPSADKVSWPISKVYRDGTAFTNWGVKLETASTPGHKLAFYMGYGTGRKYIYANSPWVVGQPQHYTIVAYSDGGVGIYLNGQLDKYQAGVAGQKILPSTKRDLAIGTFANGPSPTDDFAGLFDNVNIWHQALSDGEIQEVYQMAIPEPASGLLAILGALVMVRRRSNRCCY